MATIWEETKVQTKKMKDKSFREKAEYFWEYYKIHTVLAIVAIVFISSIVHAYVTAKDYGLSIIMINAVSPDSTSDYSQWISDLTSLTQIDTKEYEIYIDDTITLGTGTNTANAEYASQQKLAALMSSQSIDLIIANTSQFEHYSQLTCFADLRDILPDDEVKKYENANMIYYTDASTFSDFDNDNMDADEIQSAYIVDHHDASSMKDPVPVGLFIDNGTLIADANLYTYLLGIETFQGYPQNAVIGIPVNSPRIENAVIGMHYILND